MIIIIKYFIKKPTFPEQASFMINTSSILSPVTSDGFINCAELVGSIIYHNIMYKLYAHVADPADAYDLICCMCYLLRTGLDNLQKVRQYRTVIYFPSTMNTSFLDDYIFNGINIDVLSIRVNISRCGNLIYERWSKLQNMLQVKYFSLTNDEMNEPIITSL